MSNKGALRARSQTGFFSILAIGAVIGAGGASPALAGNSPYNILHTFDGNDGANSFAPMIADSAGNLYGTASEGGAQGAGTVFELAPNGTEQTLYTFSGGSDGSNPETGLARDSQGNLYGTTTYGGEGAGIIFKLAPDGTETVLHTFMGGADGAFPGGGLLIGKHGDLYGTTVGGGTDGSGVVFKMTPSGTETVLYSFSGGADGGSSYSPLIQDRAGNLYGTTQAGGTGNAGIVFKLAPNGTETVLYSFSSQANGLYPSYGALIMDKAGSLYGTTTYGGINGSYGNGTVFKLEPNGTESILYAFTGGKDGGSPQSGLIADHAGNLYGTTSAGGTYGAGVVFKVSWDGGEKVLYTFTGGNDGASPYANLIENPAAQKGYLYSTTTYGGAGGGDGVVFDIKK